VEKPQNNWCLFESIPTKVWTIPGTSWYLLHTQCTYIYYYYVYTLIFRPRKRILRQKAPSPRHWLESRFTIQSCGYCGGRCASFVAHWCPRLGVFGLTSGIRTWGGPDEPTCSEFAFFFEQVYGDLIFMVVQGIHGVHVDLLQRYGGMYRLCFKTDCLEAIQSCTVQRNQNYKSGRTGNAFVSTGSQ
jgi:hypothetical protein